MNCYKDVVEAAIIEPIILIFIAKLLHILNI